LTSLRQVCRTFPVLNVMGLTSIEPLLADDHSSRKDRKEAHHAEWGFGKTVAVTKSHRTHGWRLAVILYKIAQRRQCIDAKVVQTVSADSARTLSRWVSFRCTLILQRIDLAQF